MGFFFVVRFNCDMISDIKQAGKCCAVTQSWMQALFGWGREAAQLRLHHCSVCGHHYMTMLVCSKDAKVWLGFLSSPSCSAPSTCSAISPLL